ncbi:hypothetical protein FWD20_00225 [Candidatus Saccharibacteria bacterium]|nr:hypothetical protein [Candidatus Saccharibacteria bacterium]
MFKLDLSVYDETAARTALNDALNHITITQLRSMREAGMDSEHPYALIANFVPTKKFSHSELETANAKLNPDDHFEALDYRDQYTEDQLNGDYRTKSGQEGFVVEFIPVEPNINAAKQKDQIDQLDRLNSIEGANWSVPGDASSMIYQQVLADKGLLTGDDNPSKTSIVRLDLESKAGDPDSYRNLAWDELVDMFRPITYRVDYGRAFLVGAGVDVDKDVSRVAIKPKFD